MSDNPRGPEWHPADENDQVEVLGVKMSSEINFLAEALAKAQGEIEDPAKNSTNTYFNNAQYADLSQVLGVIRPAFSKHGLALVQHPSVEEEGYELVTEVNDRGEQRRKVGGTIALTTMVTHSSGQWMASRMHIPVLGSNAAQEAGKVITYMRRYAGAAVGAVAQVDNDANDENQERGLPPQTARPVGRGQQAPRNAPKPISIEQVAEVRRLIEESGADEAKLCEHFKVDSIGDLKPVQHKQAVQMLTAKKKQAAEGTNDKPADAAPAS